MRVSGVEFLRRWSLHILPPGCHRVRYYGGLHPSKRKAYQSRCRTLLGESSSDDEHPAASIESTEAPPSEAALRRRQLQQGTCPDCGGTGLDRLFSRFSVRKSDQSVYEDILSNTKLVRGLESNDPHALAEWNTRISRGEEVAPEYEEMMDKLEHGEMPQHPAGGGETSEDL